MVAASLFVTDAAQSIAAGGLRGLKDTRVPLLFVCIAYWLIGFSLGYVLGLKIGLGCDWHLDWLVNWDDHLCGAPRPAFPTAGEQACSQSRHLIA